VPRGRRAAEPIVQLESLMKNQQFSLNRIQQKLHPPGGAEREVLRHHLQIISYSRLDARKKASRCGVPYGLQSRTTGAPYRLLK
jgi:hypothetical protein